MTGRRAAQLAAWAGLLSLQGLTARTYLDFGTWWHWLMHVQIGWGLGLATAALVGALTRYRVPALPALLVGQLVSITPDLQFRFLRMPHEPSMDVYLGHISIHTGPSPVLVALGSVLLGGWAWTATAYGRRRLGAGLAAGSMLLVLVACLAAGEIPTRLADVPLDTARITDTS